MGLWRDHLLPRVLDRGMRGDNFASLRATVTPGLAGRVLEIGFGTGLNLPHYPPTVERLVAVDPVRVGRKIARKRLAAAPFPVEFVDLEDGRLPLADASVDAAVATWTLCSIDGLDGALAEIRRVLAPGARFHFLEHGLSPEPKIARWQRRLTPIQRVVAGGCRFDVPIDERLRAAGFALERLDHPELEGAPKVAGHLYRGVAARAGREIARPRPYEA